MTVNKHLSNNSGYVRGSLCRQLSKATSKLNKMKPTSLCLDKILYMSTEFERNRSSSLSAVLVYIQTDMTNTTGAFAVSFSYVKLKSLNMGWIIYTY